MLEGVIAHTDYAIRQIAKHPPAILSRNDRETTRAYRMALFRSKDGIRFRFLDGDNQFVFGGIIGLNNAL